MPDNASGSDAGDSLHDMGRLGLEIDSLRNETKSIWEEIERVKEHQQWFSSFTTLVISGAALLLGLTTAVLSVLDRRRRARITTDYQNHEASVIDAAWEQVLRSLKIVGQTVLGRMRGITGPDMEYFQASMSALSRKPGVARGGIQHLALLQDPSALPLLYTVCQFWRDAAVSAPGEASKAEAKTAADEAEQLIQQLESLGVQIDHRRQ